MNEHIKNIPDWVIKESLKGVEERWHSNGHSYEIKNGKLLEIDGKKCETVDLSGYVSTPLQAAESGIVREGKPVVSYPEDIQFYESKTTQKINSKGSLTVEQVKKIVNFAYEQIGTPYNFELWAEKDIPSVALTCNGLTRWAYNAAGIDIPAGSREQMANAPIVTSTGNIDDMSPGDIICYDDEGRRSDVQYNLSSYRHVALYVGDGMMIEAPGSINGVDPGVRLTPVRPYSYSVTF